MSAKQGLVLRSASALGLAVAVLVTGTSPADARPGSSVSVEQPAVLKSDQRLEPGRHLLSPNGAYKLVMQADGNLVLQSRGRAVWGTRTDGNSGAYAHMQRDGNLVVRSASGKSLWDTGTQNRGATLHVQDDGNVVIRSKTGKPLWSWHTAVSRMYPDQVLRAHQYLRSVDGDDKLLMQADGNLVLLTDGRPVWSSHTEGNPGAFMQLQLDGNLVVRSASGDALWDTGTQHKGATVHLQDDGNLVVRSSTGKVLWAAQ
ncbi:hypothetical protein [Nonomuraea sp. SYSU D8015]|uniref:hypothetical protein n=1 Tax=Nonomuraea sp. SYSU D8015 TaxID=2593644 RepID=UPI001660AE8D|nr:hypothetical protein [Nonomuraea sp. SYSU D8015]